ncbi:hypothetical protein HN51_026019, partial [Arachis hypogaea]
VFHFGISILWANLGLNGQPFFGLDFRGFAGNATPRIFGRWMGEEVILKKAQIIMNPGLLGKRLRSKSEKEILDLRHYILLFAMDTIKLAVASEIRGRVTGDSRNAILANIQEQDSDRAATKRATHALANLAKNEEVVNVIVEGGVIPTLVQHLQALSVTEEDLVQKLLPFEHEVEKGSALHFDFLPSRDSTGSRTSTI